jgi:hypothetical protein
MQKETDEVITDENEEFSQLKDHSQKLLTQIKKSKDRKQCIQKLEQENQNIEKNLSKENEKNSCLKNLNQGLLEQIKRLKKRNLKIQTLKISTKSDNEENSRLKNHNISRHYYEVRFNSTFIKRPERPLKGDPLGKSMVNVKNAKRI